jgi:hypothetical protein
MSPSNDIFVQSSSFFADIKKGLERLTAGEAVGKTVVLFDKV